MNMINTKRSGTTASRGKLTLRKPMARDGADVWHLIRACAPLDENSMYCNLLQCDHFADTCVVAELDGDIVGWVSGYIVPSAPDTLFVWQVAVDAKARGMGLAKKMLTHLLAREVCDGVARLQTTITADNGPSWALFSALADRMDAPLDREAHFEEAAHFDGAHATEFMVTIGEFGTLADRAGDKAA